MEALKRLLNGLAPAVQQRRILKQEIYGDVKGRLTA